MSKNIDHIIAGIDAYLDKRNIVFTNPVKVSKYLDREGLLNDSAHRPGKPLRDLLRKGLIRHAFQEGRKWVIPKSDSIKNPSSKKTSPPEKQKIDNNASDLDFIQNETDFRSVGTIDNIVPSDPGYYCFRIKNINELPDFFGDELKKRSHNILYIGLASKSLKRRMLGQELRARGHGTFFRSIGAVLGFRPEKGSLLDKKNKRNYKFNEVDENKIIQWMNKNLFVHWTTVDFVDNDEETKLIGSYKPLLNIAKNPLALEKLRILRRECVEIANT